MLLTLADLLGTAPHNLNVMQAHLLYCLLYKIAALAQRVKQCDLCGTILSMHRNVVHKAQTQHMLNSDTYNLHCIAKMCADFRNVTAEMELASL